MIKEYKQNGGFSVGINVLLLGRESCQVGPPGPAKPIETETDSRPDAGSTICPSHTASWDMLN